MLNPKRKKFHFVATSSTIGLICIALAIRREGKRQCKKALNQESIYLPKKTMAKKKSSTVAVNAEFLHRFQRLLRILFPKFWSPEVGYTALVAILLVTRTTFDITILHITTAIERAIISRSAKHFQWNLTRFFLIMAPVSCVNALLKYGQAEMTLRFRARLTAALYKKYLTGFVYYKLSNLDNRISNVDQLLTQDVERLSTSITNLYSNLSKPFLDILLYSFRLTASIGIQGPASMMSYLVGSGMFLTWLRQPTGRFTAAEQQMEGTFRYMNSRLITHSEEVAFYNGNDREHSVLRTSFSHLLNVCRKSQQFRYAISTIDNVVAKYFATVVGFYLVSRPFLDLKSTRHLNTSHSDRMEDYYRSGRMMIKLSEAMGRLILSGRELTRLACFTVRITELFDVLDELRSGKYTRTMVNPSNDGDDTQSLKPSSGKITYQDHVIEFKDVPLVTPNGDILVRAMNFTVHSGMNVVVSGPNGCGKSSMFRTLGELWPLFGGELTKPHQKDLFYIPQRPYLTLGTLRDQVIYPHAHEKMLELGRTDEELVELLNIVQLQPILEREGGWDAIQDWADVLSGGEKQRIAMARLFYHAPQFAILDECTSAVSIDVEGAMYQYCREQNITLFTVSHRQSLWKYHDYVLQFDGRGSYKFHLINDNHA